MFSLYERELKESELLMDGIVVSAAVRGRGVGTKLLESLKGFAAEQDYCKSGWT